MEKIEVTSPGEHDFRNLGRRLAAFHAITNEKFGYERDNYIGLNRQRNVWIDNWGEFFLRYRLEYQIGLVSNARLRAEFETILKDKRRPLVDFLNAHRARPSLLHGDLWAGNVLFSTPDIYLIDPAVYFGDRECDIAMTKLFGGFANSFYEEYEKAAPLPERHEIREGIYNLYHYLNHFNLFGSGYLSGVREGFRILQVLRCKG